jgi:hypothetical protein
MNALGVDVRGLDVQAFILGARALFAVLGLAWLALLLRIRRPAWLLAGVLLANAWAWGITNYPLQRLYGLGPSHDRVWNLGMCQVVAAGNSPLQTPQVGQLHFEPFWGVLVAVVSGWSPGRVLALYPFFPLVMACAFALSLEYGLRAAGEPCSAWARVLAAAFATLLSSSPLDFAGAYRVPWAMGFLLKPNHALGLVLFPLLLRAFASIRGWPSRLAVGLLLHLLGWVFVIHMVYVAFGLAVFAAWSLLERRPEARRDVLDAALVILVNVLVVSPYIYMLLAGYPLAQPGPRMAIPPWSPHLLEVTTRSTWLTLLGAWGTVLMHRRGNRFGRAWSAQVVGAYALWLAYIPLAFFQLARERDELFFWIRYLMAASAGIGAWDLAGRVAGLVRRLDAGPAMRAAAVGALALPWSFPYWWDPISMDRYFTGSVSPIPGDVRSAMDFVRNSTPPDAVFAGDRGTTAGYLAALGARRMLLAEGLHAPPRRDERETLEAQLFVGGDVPNAREASSRFNVRYLLVTPAALARYPGVSLEQLESRPDLERVHLSGPRDGEFIAVFRLRL